MGFIFEISRKFFLTEFKQAHLHAGFNKTTEQYCLIFGHFAKFNSRVCSEARL